MLYVVPSMSVNFILGSVDTMIIIHPPSIIPIFPILGLWLLMPWWGPHPSLELQVLPTPDGSLLMIHVLFLGR